MVRWIPERAEFVAMGDAVVTTADGDAWTPGHRFAPWMVVDYAWNPTAGEFLAVGPRTSPASAAPSSVPPTSSPRPMPGAAAELAADGYRLERPALRGGGRLRQHGPGRQRPYQHRRRHLGPHRHQLDGLSRRRDLRGQPVCRRGRGRHRAHVQRRPGLEHAGYAARQRNARDCAVGRVLLRSQRAFCR